MASKGGRDKIKLESTAGTGHFYTTTKNKKTMPEKLLIMKFDPKARKHVEYNNGWRMARAADWASQGWGELSLLKNPNIQKLQQKSHSAREAPGGFLGRWR